MNIQSLNCFSAISFIKEKVIPVLTAKERRVQVITAAVLVTLSGVAMSYTLYHRLKVKEMNLTETITTQDTWLGRHAKWVHEKSSSQNRFVRICTKVWAVAFTALLCISLIFIPKAIQFQKLLNELKIASIHTNPLASPTQVNDEPQGAYLDGSCDNFLKPSFFNPYLAQLKFTLDQQPVLKMRIDQLMPSPFKDRVLELYEHLNKPLAESSTEFNRAYYKQFLHLLRACQKEASVITSKTDTPFIFVRNFLDKFIQNYMKEVVVYKPGMEFLYKKGLSKDIAIQKMSDIAPALESGFNQLSHIQNTGLVEGLFDPSLLGNLPYQTFELQSKNGKKISVFRCSNMTKDEEQVNGKLVKGGIGEQFNLYLDSCRREGKKHLYINLMQRKTANNEAVRTDVIENLEAKYPGTLNVVSLDRNSSFYLQSKEYAQKDQAAQFKADFKKHLRNDNCYFWSADLKRETWEQELDTMIDNIHQTYFQSADRLSLEQRQAFIELAYCMIIDSLIAKFEPDSCNFSCKVCIDRGGLTNAMMYLYYVVKNQGVIQPDQFNYLQYLIHLPALLASNRPIQKIYLDRLSTFAKVFLGSNQPMSRPLPQNDYVQGIRTREETAIFDQPKAETPFDTLTLELPAQLKWRAEHFTAREKLPLLSPAQRLEVESRHLDKLPKIKESVEKRIAELNIPLDDVKKSEIVDIVTKHYLLTMQYYSPAVLKWMDSLLQRKDERKLIFLARDGIIFHEVATILLERNSAKYPHASKDKLAVAWLSRKSSKYAATQGDLAERYFKQLGIQPNDPILLVDTGCTGSIKREIAPLIKNPLECQFSVSRNPTIHGFWDNSDFSIQALAFVKLPDDHEDAWANDPKSANDWVEDTHSGNFISAEKLVEDRGVIYPSPSMEWVDTDKGQQLVTKEAVVKDEKGLRDFLVREFGRKAIIDFAQEADISDSTLNYDQIKLNLNDALTRIQKNEVPHASCKHD